MLLSLKIVLHGICSDSLLTVFHFKEGIVYVTSDWARIYFMSFYIVTMVSHDYYNLVLRPLGKIKILLPERDCCRHRTGSRIACSPPAAPGRRYCVYIKIDVEALVIFWVFSLQCRFVKYTASPKAKSLWSLFFY